MPPPATEFDSLPEAVTVASFSDYLTEPFTANAACQHVFEHSAVTDYPLTLRHRNGNGTRTETLDNASLCRDTDGNVLGVFASARNVTQLTMIDLRKQIEHLKMHGPAGGGER